MTSCMRDRIIRYFPPTGARLADLPVRDHPRQHYGPRQGSVAFSLCTTAHPLHTRFTNTFGASVSETIMRPNPA
jgi:hypothetical protein